MNYVTRAAAALALAAAAGAAASASPSNALPDLPIVTTLAGSGYPGIADGRGLSAEFEGPNGLAYDAAGNLYVADGPGQRIRKINPLGNVTTLAGTGAPVLFGSGVTGGYRDGPAAAAQFSNPVGVAIAPDGTVYVADLLNHCVRMIKGGVVTTFAGNPAKAGKDDGPALSATFTNPRGIAVDNGTVFVTDYPNGVRRITSGGVVSTMKEPELQQAWGLATFDRGDADELIAAGRYGVSIYDLKHDRITYTFATSWPFGFLSPSLPSPSEGSELTGPAMAVAAINASEFVYADAVFSTVRLVQVPNSYTRTLGDQPLLNASKLGGGFREGALALYQQPTGIAVGPSGQIAVADTGNKRIRRLSDFDRQTAGVNSQRLPTTPDPHALRIAIVGDSLVWTNVARSESIAGIVNDRLCAQLHSAGACTVETYPTRIDGAQVADLVAYADAHFSGGNVNDVYLFVSADRISNSAEFSNSIQSLKSRLASTKTRLVVVLTPSGMDLPSEMLYRKSFDGPADPGLSLKAYATATDALKRASVEVVDLWPSFFENDSKPGFRPLFGAWDDHLTLFGNRLAGDAVAENMAQTATTTR
jgi:SGNH hydrolase-like domain, acetyltransferase AlgX/NHL repeat